MTILDREQSADFIESFGGLADRVALIGALNGLAQVALKGTMPGVPDFYQGTELWDLSLVDPDNRRPGRLPGASAGTAITDQECKLGQRLRRPGPMAGSSSRLTARLLAGTAGTREDLHQWRYQPLQVKGRDCHEIVAFARGHDADAVLVIAARLFNRVTQCGRRWPSPRGWDATVSVGGLFCASATAYRAAGATWA